MTTDANLVLVRHGQSEWNMQNLFTGWKDVELTEQGIAEAVQAGQEILDRQMIFDVAFTSELKRAQETLRLILEKSNQESCPVTRDQALNERDYGDLTGKNKDQARAEFGEDQVHIWRRSYDIPPPGGESLKDTEERTWPYFESTVLPLLAQGKTVIVAAHGNSLRAIIKRLEGISSEDITQLEIATGVPIYYHIAADGQVTSKDSPSKVA